MAYSELVLAIPNNIKILTYSGVTSYIKKIVLIFTLLYKSCRYYYKQDTPLLEAYDLGYGYGYG